MKTEIKIPTMGESISEAVIGTILKPSGSAVAADEEIIELETQKVNQLLYAPQKGVIQWNVSSGDTVTIGQVIGTIDSEAQAQVASESPQPSKSSAEQPKSSEKPEETTAQKTLEKPEETTAQQKTQEMPSLESPQEDMRISRESYLKTLSAPAPASSKKSEPVFSLELPEPAPGQQVTRKKMSTIRKVIATRLVEVMQQTAMLTTFNEVDMSAIISLRETYKELFAKKHGTKLGFMSFFVKASVSALKAFPQVNTSIEGDEILYYHDYSIGVAVGTDRGLVVPVVHNCEKLSFAEVERSIEAYAKKAREGGLSISDLTGGNFTVTNGGVYGSLLSTPILNPPQSAILGMHKILKRPVVVNDEIVIRPIMNLALSYDHRVIDGKDAVGFLVHIKECLEDPERLQLEV